MLENSKTPNSQQNKKFIVENFGTKKNKKSSSNDFI